MKLVPRRLVKYITRTSGDARELPIGARRLEACCDCGLVHIHDYAVEKGKVIERVYRDKRSTAALRRKMVTEGSIHRENSSNAYVLILRIRANRARKPLKVRYTPIPVKRK